MAGSTHTPDEAAALFTRAAKNAGAKKYVIETVPKLIPGGGPYTSNKLDAWLAEHFGGSYRLGDIHGMKWVQVAAMVERLEKSVATDDEPPQGGDANDGIPSEIEDRLRECTNIQILPMRLLNVMWMRRSVTQGDLVPYVWDDQPSQSALKSAVHKANDALLIIQHKQMLTLSGGEISWK